MNDQKIGSKTVGKNRMCRCVVVTPDGSGRIALPSCLCCRGTGLHDPDRQKTIDRNTNRRIPTAQEFLAFDGGHCRNLYASLPAAWQCPACCRNKYQLLRWTMRFPHSPHRFEGWVIGLHNHHDHGIDPAWALPRFPTTIVCEQCNSADATVKRKLNLPENFSFSPAEISQFVTATPHGWHLIDYECAARIYSAMHLAKLNSPAFW